MQPDHEQTDSDTTRFEISGEFPDTRAAAMRERGLDFYCGPSATDPDAPWDPV